MIKRHHNILLKLDTMDNITTCVAKIQRNAISMNSPKEVKLTWWILAKNAPKTKDKKMNNQFQNDWLKIKY